MIIKLLKLQQQHIEIANNRVKARWWKKSLTKWQIKVLLTIGGLSIVISVLAYTHGIVSQLVEREHRLVTLYADILQTFSTRSFEQNSPVMDFFFIRDSLTPAINFPVIITDADDQAIEPYAQFSLNLELDSAWSQAQSQHYVQDYVNKMKTAYKGIEIRSKDGRVISKVYYTNSVLVTRLRYLPYIEILIVAVFIGIGYLAFSHLRRTEETNVWVGMAKEAAHQLGTPLSSLLAWIELMRDEQSHTARMGTLQEMENDVERLKIIANRFSLIGSQPKLSPMNLESVVEPVCQYFEKRLPQFARHVHLERRYDTHDELLLNRELFSWVLENLLKNAIEAIDHPNGNIRITVQKHSKQNVVSLELSDNGKGMTGTVRKQIFQPGFTTKSRGWGLGLSLSQRIVEDYHGGRLVVKHSEPGHGTTFLINLPLSIQS